MTSGQAAALGLGGGFALLGGISVVPYIVLTHERAQRLKWLGGTALAACGLFLVITVLGIASGLSFPEAMLYTGSGGRGGEALTYAITAAGVAIIWGAIEAVIWWRQRRRNVAKAI